MLIFYQLQKIRLLVVFLELYLIKAIKTISPRSVWNSLRPVHPAYLIFTILKCGGTKELFFCN